MVTATKTVDLVMLVDDNDTDNFIIVKFETDHKLSDSG
jgi:hypothetical protein